ncbi:MAG: hypothetical protein C1943_18135 [Halochromatium sp.]|nr:hypothetical protein [Halochromatium sp.]
MIRNSFTFLQPFSVSATVVGGNGTVSCTPASVTVGGDSACTAVPAAGFQVLNWTDACAAAGSNAHCALTNYYPLSLKIFF